MNTNIHILLLFVIMGITLVYALQEESYYKKRICVTAVTVILALFSGFRTWWFGDLIKYYSQYRACTGTDWKSTVYEKWANVGLRMFFHIAGSLHISYDICIFLIALLSAVSLGIFIFRYSPSPYWSYLIYIGMGFYFFTYSGLKQTIAMSFLMFAMGAIIDDNPKKFVIWTFIAFIFHAPAILFIIAYPISRKKVDLVYVLILGIMMATIYSFHGQIVNWLSDAYYENEIFTAVGFTLGGRTIMMILIMVVAVFMRPLRRGDIIFGKVFNLMVLSAMIQVFSMYDNNFTRLADYYYQFSFLFIALMMEDGEHQALVDPRRKYEIRYFSKESLRLIGACITVFCVWYYMKYINGSSVLLNDYKFFWQINPYSLYGK